MKDSPRSLMIAKVPLLGAIAAFTGTYLYLLVNWGATRHYAAPYVLAYSILAIATAFSAGAATFLLTRQNLPRVITSTIVMLICTAFGWYLGDPMTQGSYDHGGGESVIGWLTGGVIGALVGWLAMSIWRYQHDFPTHDKTDTLPKSDPPASPTTP